MRTDRRRMITYKELPYGFERLEYIYTLNSAYIDTGIYSDKDVRIEVSFKYKNVPTQYLFGSGYTDWETVNFLHLTQDNDIVFNNTRVIKSLLKENGRFTISTKENKVTLSNAEGVIAEGYAGSYAKRKSVYTIALFNTRNGNGSVPGYFFCESSIAKVSIFKGENLTRHFIPVKRKSDGLIGMYDTVGGKFYTSPNAIKFLGGKP